MKCPLLTVLFGMTAAVAAAQSREAGPAFEVASVKVAAASPDARSADANPLIRFRNEGGPGTASPGQWTCMNMPLYPLLLMAWNFDRHQLSGPPSMYDARYDIIAKVPPGTSRADFSLMIQRLLNERIGLVVHHERKELDVREVVIAKGGLKMKPAEAAPADAPAVAPGISRDKDGDPWLPPGYPQATRILDHELLFCLGRMQSIEEVIKGLPIAQMIVDKTGLTGKYDYAVKLPLPEANATPDAAFPEASSPAGLFVEALVAQLGLKLQAAKALVDILVVDRFNRVPTEN